MNYEQKYKEALQRAKKLQKTCDSQAVVGWCEYMFPELIKNEDDRIRKEIVDFIVSINKYGTNERCEVWLTWLEKQKTSEEAMQYLKENHSPSEISDFQAAMNIAVAKAYDKGMKDAFEKQGEQETLCDKCRKEHPSHSCQDITELGRCAVEHEHKPVDKVEPNFKVGDWLCENEPNNYARFIQILEIVNVQGKERYRISRDIHNDEDIVEFDFVEKYYHKFDIKDAKDGDVLSYVTDEEDLWIMIYLSLYEPYEGHVHYHALLVNDNFTGKGTCCICINDLKPATKEQRDLLFQKMKEAGYEWDAEKKELKMIEHKPAVWSEHDEYTLKGIVDEIEANKSNAPDYDLATYDRFLSWLKSLKQRIGG